MGQQFSTEKHGHVDRAMFDKYVADPKKFNDLTNKLVAITGTSSGSLGYFIAEVAIKKHAKMILCLNRDSDSAKRGEDDLKSLVVECKSPTVIQTVACDLQDLAMVKRAGDKVNKIAKENGGLDVLVLNAGIMAAKDKRTKDGFELHMQTNQLSHFALTQSVWKSIELAANNRGEARIITQTSFFRNPPITSMLKEKFFLKSEPNTLGGDKTWSITEVLRLKEGVWERYHQSKLANSAFMMELRNKLQKKGVTNIKAMVADPGVASSTLIATSIHEGLQPTWAAKFAMLQGHSAENGSLPAAMAAFSPEANSGDLYVPNRTFIGTPFGIKSRGYPIKSIQEGKPVKKRKEKLTCNRTNQENVWKFCEKALDIIFEV